MKISEDFKGQLEIGHTRSREADRNYHLGGRSFYFFDFDDNIAFLTTPMVLFHKITGTELLISSGEWAEVHGTIGKSGFYADFEVRFEEPQGSFRHFRDLSPEEMIRLNLKSQTFVQDVQKILAEPDMLWKGPSWDCFYHAVFNERPVSVITARGHHPETFKSGIDEFVKKGYLPSQPNYLSIFPVSHLQTRKSLGDEFLQLSTAALKQKAMRASVEKAIETYGYSDHHRFGMSDDDPKNIQSIFEEMRRLKKDYPEMSFFMIETHQGQFVKHEVGLNDTFVDTFDPQSQLDLFG
ncbi:MAG: hypothetical protein ACK5P5_12425 [Pseudobdellovibrionaceae bacterium]